MKTQNGLIISSIIIIIIGIVGLLFRIEIDKSYFFATLGIMIVYIGICLLGIYCYYRGQGNSNGLAALLPGIQGKIRGVVHSPVDTISYLYIEIENDTKIYSLKVSHKKIVCDDLQKLNSKKFFYRRDGMLVITS